MRTRRKINLKLYDIDGCLYHDIYPTTENKNSFFIDSNKEFLRANINDINENDYDESLLAFGTNRQDHPRNAYNAKDSMPMNQSLPLLQSLFSKFVRGRVMIDPFLLGDLYGFTKEEVLNFKAGDTYTNILLHELKEDNLNHPSYVFDDRKISLIYAFVHRIANLYPDDEIVIDFYDDKLEILNALKIFYEKYKQHVLPENIKLNLNNYTGKGVGSWFYTIQGESKRIDDHYDWTVRYLSSQYYRIDAKSDSALEQDYQLQTAAQLKKYHEENHYSYPNRDLTMGFWTANTKYFDVAKFLNMRDKEIPTLASNLEITKAKNFTTATDLVNRKLLRTGDAYVAEDALKKFTAFYLNGSEMVLSKEIAPKPNGMSFWNADKIAASFGKQDSQQLPSRRPGEQF